MDGHYLATGRLAPGYKPNEVLLPMKTKLFFSVFITFFLLLFAAGAGGADRVVSDSPSVYLPESHYVFEPVVDGTKIIHDFVLQNKGTTPLKIEKVKTD